MALIEFEAIVSHPVDERLNGFYIDHPREGMRCEAAAVDIWGWVVGRAQPAVAAEVLHDGRLVKRVPLDARPDVAAAYPEWTGAATSGFHASLRMLGVSAAELQVLAVLKDHSRVPLATLRARGRWREADTDVPLVSVVIPCFNQATYLSDAIESVLGQTYPHLEVVVVDDGSTDNTEEVGQRYPGVRVIRQENRGRSAARNTGIRRSNGDYLVFLDADDRLVPCAIAAGLDAFRAHPEVAFVCGQTRVVAADGSISGNRPRAEIDGDTFAAMLRRCYVFCTASAMYRRSVFDVIAGFRTEMVPCEDYDMYLRVARTFPVFAHETLTAEYRWHGTNTSAQAVRMFETARRVLRAQWPHVRRRREYRLAYRQGMRDLQDWCGGQVVRDTRTALLAGEFGRAARGLWSLSRCHPRGVLDALFGGSQ